ncbi:AzlD domain-containing protein [Ruminococcus sp. OA3]|uniref:AzlD domain-containing protein n=1 Tax=Ruminococcus sp. OA3 TaxID=2914164 RepID=UPI001F06C4E9|nr:AzlD domain-containing protein [Ruminococcus sp. OA3]MCH1982721.1 AzlD domain-containing protein [Ruminococcus sp. OA3]
MQGNIYIYILVMAAVTYAVRALPLTLIRKKITNRYIQSFLYYVPYATLAAMTFPAILYSTGDMVSAVCGFAAALFLAYRGKGLLPVAAGACVVVFVVQLAMRI